MKRLSYLLRSCLIFLALIGCHSKQTLPQGEGFIQLTDGKVWYRVVGHGDKTPLLLLHGGPGATSYYLNPMASLGQERPVIFLDQLGCGRSETVIDTSMMTVDHFVEQLEEFRKGLGLEEFYLYGHSWGTMLGVDYYFKYPEAVKAMILASPALSVNRWTDDANRLIAALPDSIQNLIELHTTSGTFESTEYQHAVGVYYLKYLARRQPWSADLDSAFSNLNHEVYSYMWGPSEFTALGTLKTYERSDQLHKIKVPTLFITGEFDEATPATVEYYQSLIPNAQMSVISGSGHITMHDNPDENNKVISEFLSVLEE
jgi:proline iminopeptidase